MYIKKLAFIGVNACPTVKYNQIKIKTFAFYHLGMVMFDSNVCVHFEATIVSNRNN